MGLPYTTIILDVVAEVMREMWSTVDPRNLPKQEVVGAAIASRLGWKPLGDGKPTRAAMALASAIRPDRYVRDDRRVRSIDRAISSRKPR